MCDSVTWAAQVLKMRKRSSERLYNTSRVKPCGVKVGLPHPHLRPDSPQVWARRLRPRAPVRAVYLLGLLTLAPAWDAYQAVNKVREPVGQSQTWYPSRFREILCRHCSTSSSPSACPLFLHFCGFLSSLVGNMYSIQITFQQLLVLL